MGLDMYLNKRVYVGANYKHNEVTGVIDLKTKGNPISIQLNRVNTIIENVGYWRKANQIHNWFVKNVQNGKDDCGEYYVSDEQLNRLLADCKKVKENESVAAEVMPTKSGFFFGGTEYDQFYMENIDDTIMIIEAVLSEDDGDYYYSSSW